MKKVIVITGASSGIGAATARLLAQEGYPVVLGARHESALKSLVQEIHNQGGQAVYQVTDVTRETDVQALINMAQMTFGRIDVLVNNAGIMPNAPLYDVPLADWNRTIDVNLRGVLNGLAAVLPIFDQQQSGQVISVSSLAGLKQYPNAGVYGATKAAVKYVMENLRAESAQRQNQVRATTIYPAAIQTDLTASITDTTVRSQIAHDQQTFGINPIAIAQAIHYAVVQPADVTINELSVFPTKQTY